MNPDKCKILKNLKSIAVVGISRNPFRISRGIANYLVNHGYDVHGVNPNQSFIKADSIKVYNNLLEIPHKIDIVNVFRRSEDIHEIIDDLISIKPKVLWLQLGIWNDNTAKKAEEMSINVIQDSCIKIEHDFCLRNIS